MNQGLYNRLMVAYIKKRTRILRRQMAALVGKSDAHGEYALLEQEETRLLDRYLSIVEKRIA